jgi:AraC-like DNA-binding protein
MNIVKEIFDEKIRDFSFQKTVVFDDLLRYKLTSLVTAVNNKENNSFLVNELFVAMVEALFDRNSHHSSKDIIPSKRDSLVIKATNLIDETIYEPLTLEEICSELNISKYHFIRIFKGQVGMTPYQYMLDIKMKLACEDLEYGEDILKVVDKYGFYDLSHFHKRFKKVFGVTPLEYQKYMI